jgi:hypothetical protein
MAPVTWPRWMVIRTARPRMVIQRRRGALRGNCAYPHHARDTAPQQHSRGQPHDESLHNPGIVLYSSFACIENARLPISRAIHRFN